jgi:hypothetical protein
VVLTAETVPVSLEEVEAEADQIYQAGWDLMAFATSHGLLPAFG